MYSRDTSYISFLALCDRFEQMTFDSIALKLCDDLALNDVTIGLDINYYGNISRNLRSPNEENPR